jgi:hypothetical protein
MMAESKEELMMRLIEQQQYENMRQRMLARNMAYANPDWQQQMTQLNPQQEQAFLQWVQANQVPFDPKDKFPDYDMRGYYLSTLNNPQATQAAINPVDNELHYPDDFKTPYHESFSSESKWAMPGAPSWDGERLMSPKGEVVYETPKQKE